jgi:hypothetical protein
MQVKWKKKGVLEISRFCNELNISVTGGFTKLLKGIIVAESPDEIMTFTDLRYGDGEYLKDFGFEKATNHLSFKWTDFYRIYNRMNFPGNSGYNVGLFKIWDCGQAKWVLKTEHE